MAHLLLSMRATSMPGTMRNSSGKVVAPERRMSSGVMTNTAAGDSPTVLSRLETVVTSTLMSSSTLSFFRSLEDVRDFRV